MRKVFIAVAFFLGALSMPHAQKITSPSEGKAVIYFVRVSAYAGVIDFSYFDSSQLIGEFNSRNYMRYECSPGEHLFWAHSENEDFITADLEAGKIYFVEAVPSMGMLYAQVFLHPIDPKDSDRMEKIENILNKFSPRTLSEEDKQKKSRQFATMIPKALEKYSKELSKGKKKFKRLEKNMFYEGTAVAK